MGESIKWRKSAGLSHAHSKSGWWPGIQVHLSVAFVALHAEVLCAQTVWHVRGDADGSTTGLNWEDAFIDLHDALAGAQAGDEIWIARGIYKPDRRTKDRTLRFQLVSGVAVYGGFAGWETLREQRDWQGNQTVLSGDLNGDDGPQDCAEHSNCCVARLGVVGCDNAECEAIVCETYPHCCGPSPPDPREGWDSYCAFVAALDCCDLGSWQSCENSHAVVAGKDLEESTELDGVAIQGSYASVQRDGPFPFPGAGLQIENSTLTLANCTFRANLRGIVGPFNSLTLNDCDFLDNAHNPISIGSSTRATVLRRCIFANNGYSAWVGWTDAADCEFRNNRTRSALETSGTSIVRNCSFLHNQGGSLDANRDSVRVDNCLFIGNKDFYALHVGGTVATVTNSVFVRNLSAAVGGTFSSVTLINCLLAENTTRLWAGINLDVSSLRVKNSTIAFNYSTGGLDPGISLSEGTAIIENSILWGNSRRLPRGQKDQITLYSGARATINHSIVQDWDGTIAGANTFDADPLFAPGPAGDYYLSQSSGGNATNSPAVDAGNNTTADPSIFSRTTSASEGSDASPVDIGVHFPITGEILIYGDFDRNGIVNLFDYSGFQNCFDADSPGEARPSCRIFDFDTDHQVALFDLSQLVLAMSNH